MNAKLLLPICLLAIAASTSAQEPSRNIDASASSEPLRWNTEMPYWDHLLVEQKQTPPLKLGKSGYNLGGPLVNSFRRRPLPDRTFAQKVLDLPIINLFVPGPMPDPPDTGGSYFAWRGESTRPWTYAASGGAGIRGNTAFHDHEPVGTLISVGK